MRARAEEHVDLLLVCSTGGHLAQLRALRETWEPFSHAWVTFDKSDARSLLAGERVYYAFQPTNRNAKNLARNLWLAWRLLGRLRPKVVLTTGAGVAVPFAWMARLRGSRFVYVESFTRIDAPSLSCRLVAPVADRIYAQWPELVETVPQARYVGNVFSRG
jgi:UDP-N-acetylglucosamine:LPS N-acetylglucosamine transferase